MSDKEYNDQGQALDDWNAATDSLEAFKRILATTVREVVNPYAATHSTGRTITINSASLDPVELLPIDLTRSRALVRANTTDVFIGTRDQISGGGLGMVLPTGSGMELKTTDPVYVVYNSNTPVTTPVMVSVWVEWNDLGNEHI